MKLSSWISHGLCVAMGIGAAALFVRWGGAGGAKSSVISSSLQSLPAEAPLPLAQPSTERQSKSAPLATQAYSTAQPSGGEVDLIDGAAAYAASFQPGVFGAEPMPDFAANYIFTSERDKATEREQALEFAQETMDGWAADMERQLQIFFEDQPERSQVRVSVACKTSRCQVQVVERSGETRLSVALATRLYNAPWYKENFRPFAGTGATPSGVGDVYYAGLLLHRHL